MRRHRVLSLRTNQLKLKAVAIFISNYDEIEQAIDLGLDTIPSPIKDPEYIHINLKEVGCAYRNDDQDINVLIQGSMFTLAWDEGIWQQLQNSLNDGTIDKNEGL